MLRFNNFSIKLPLAIQREPFRLNQHNLMAVEMNTETDKILMKHFYYIFIMTEVTSL